MFFVISIQQLEMMLDQSYPMLLLDLRSPQAYAQAHLAGAVNIPYPQLEESILEPYRGRMLVFYCEHGGKSMQAARDFSKRGWNAYSLGCGILYYRGKYLVSS